MIFMLRTLVQFLAQESRA